MKTMMKSWNIWIGRSGGIDSPATRSGQEPSQPSPRTAGKHNRNRELLEGTAPGMETLSNQPLVWDWSLWPFSQGGMSNEDDDEELDREELAADKDQGGFLR
jgi:hypothetical protein